MSFSLIWLTGPLAGKTGSLHESALSVRHLGRSMNGLRAGMSVPPLMGAARARGLSRRDAAPASSGPVAGRYHEADRPRAPCLVAQRFPDPPDHRCRGIQAGHNRRRSRKHSGDHEPTHDLEICRDLPRPSGLQDSPLEGAGFELSVLRGGTSVFWHYPASRAGALGAPLVKPALRWATARAALCGQEGELPRSRHLTASQSSYLPPINGALASAPSQSELNVRSRG